MIFAYKSDVLFSVLESSSLDNNVPICKQLQSQTLNKTKGQQIQPSKAQCLCNKYIHTLVNLETNHHQCRNYSNLEKHTSITFQVLDLNKQYLNIILIPTCLKV